MSLITKGYYQFLHDKYTNPAMPIRDEQKLNSLIINPWGSVGEGPNRIVNWGRSKHCRGLILGANDEVTKNLG
jgi:hypothetical protein